MWNVWVPAVCLTADRALRRLSIRLAAAAGLMLGVALLASPLQVALFVGTIVSAMLVLQWVIWPPGREQIGRRLGLAGLILVIVGARARNA